METRDALQVGTVLKSPEYAYSIKSVLEQGSFGITYLASAKMIAHGPLGDIETEVKVAIKEFYMQGLSSRGSDGSVGGSSGSSLVTNYRRKFRREAENLSKMHHENIVKVFEVFDANGTTYYVMQYIKGMSLDEYIISHGHFAEKEASENLATIARALGYMHSQKMLHLDLKPKNIMRQNDGKLFLMGFGLSKHYDSNGEPESSISVGLGTPGYAPLEQDDIDDSKTFAATLDIYALGATYYKMLTGQTPPNALNVLNDQGKKLRETLAGSSVKAISLVLKMMSPLKVSRPQNVEEVLALLGSDAIYLYEEERTRRLEEMKKQVEERTRRFEEKKKQEDERTQLLEAERIRKMEEERKQKEEAERKAAEEQKRKRKRLILLIGGCVALLAIICGGIWYVVSSNDNQPAKQAAKQALETFKESQMVWVSGGTFTMGSTGSDAESDEKPLHSVSVSGYYIGKYEVTQTQWTSIMGSNPSDYKGDNRPVEEVSWTDCCRFCNALSDHYGLQRCYSISGSGDDATVTMVHSSGGFRLPTEAEWEFAARGGNSSRGYKYSGSDNIDNVAWYTDNSNATHNVGGKNGNELGIYDMSGNVWEWCWDWYGAYTSQTQTNPTGAYSGSGRVIRGGGWGSNARRCRCADRNFIRPSYRDCDLGLRLVLAL